MRHLTTQETLQIINVGGNLEVYARRFTAQEAMQIAHAAANKGSSVVFRDCRHWTAQQLMQIAQLGRGRVTFADTAG